MKVRPGESVLVDGTAGGVGSLAVQITKGLEAGQVIATAGTHERRSYASGIGADAAVDYGKPHWPKAVLKATGERGVDIILELLAAISSSRTSSAWRPLAATSSSDRHAGRALRLRRDCSPHC
jgi:NADPH:quinone reductase